MRSITISNMRFAFVSALFLLLNPALLLAQSQSESAHRAGADRLGMTCAQILQMTSSEWIAKVSSAADSPATGQLRGIKSYGACYDERTDRLAASLARSRKSPSAEARRDFSDFMEALNDFTEKALADSQPPGDALKKAYAALYEKVFRYDFYQSYEERPAASTRPKEAAPAPRPTASPATNQSAPAAGAKTSKAPMSEMTLAKNRFGELLDALPPDKLREMHAAFGKAVELPVASAQELPIYRYAIFVLEPPAASPGAPGQPAAGPKPFVPPPF